jgi:hypothetical protein
LNDKSGCEVFHAKIFGGLPAQLKLAVKLNRPWNLNIEGGIRLATLSGLSRASFRPASVCA